MCERAQGGVDLDVGHDFGEDGCEGVCIRPGGGFLREAVEVVGWVEEGGDDGFGVVVLQLGDEAGVVVGRVDEFVELEFVADFAEEDADVIFHEEGGEGAVVEGGEEGGGDEGVVGAGAEGVPGEVWEGGDEVGGWDGAETGEFVVGGESGGDGVGGAEIIKLRGEVGGGGGGGLDGDGVGPEVDAFDEALGGGEVGIVIELEKGTVGAC